MGLILYLLIILMLILFIEFGEYKKSNLLISHRNQGENLDKWLMSFSWSERSQARSSLPQYKFYTKIIEILLETSRKVGGTYQDSLTFLREGLQKDRQSERKIRELSIGIFLQMLILSLITWGFIFGAMNLTGIKIQSLKLLGIFLWQLIGGFLLPLSLIYLRRKYFHFIGQLWESLYILNSLHSSPISRSRVFELAQICGLEKIKSEALRPIINKVLQACERNLKEGRSYSEEINHSMEELSFIEKWHFELFEKKLTLLRLLLMTFFFLPSYLSFLFMLTAELKTTL